MKILSIFYGIPGSGSEWERVAKLHEILSKNHEVSLIVYSPDYRRKCDYNIDIDLIVMDKVASLIHIKRSLPIEDFDIVLGNNSLAAFFISGENSTPALYDMHGGMLEEHSINASYNKKGYTGIKGRIKLILKWVMEKQNISASSQIIVVSERMKRRLQEQWNIDQSKLYVVPNGVNPEEFDPETAPKYKSEKMVFGYVGGFNYWQGALELQEAAETHDTSEFLFVGKDGVDRANIKYIGRVPQSEIQSYYAACDILVLPRPNHPATETASPTKFAEYGAMGRPILTTNVGQPADLVKEYDCGIVVDDTADLIDGFQKFEKLSKNELSQMGTNARQMVEEELTKDMMSERINNMLQDQCR